MKSSVPEWRVLPCGLFGLCGLFGYSASNVDEIVGDHAEPDPTLHSVITFVSAATETVSLLGHADPSLASGSPFLALRNQRFFCSRLGSALLVDRLGTQTRLTTRDINGIRPVTLAPG